MRLAYQLASDLDRAVRDAGVGQCGGFFYGYGECTVFVSGPDAEAIRPVIEPVMWSFPRELRPYEDAD